MSEEGIYNTPHQERCVARLLGGNISEILPCTHEGCTMRVHRFCQNDWLHQHDLEVVQNDPFVLPTAQQVLPELCSMAPYISPPAGVHPHPILILEQKESRCMLGFLV